MSPDFNAKEAQCPGCGAPIHFQVGTSRLVVCDSCHFAVARGDRGVESLGKVADLVPTGAKITLGIEGRFQNASFRVVGRTQLQWAQGVWDEWYLSFDNGRWAWLAEAQGRYYLSFPAPARPTPPWSSLRPGKVVPLGELGRFVASDIKRAKYVAAVGELPEAIPLDGRNVRTADLTGTGSAFATLDYGVEGDDADLYIGKEVSFDSLHLDPSRLAAPPKLDRIKGEKLTCPTCNGPLELRAPDATMRVACPYCAALLDTTGGKLQHLAQLKKRSETAIKLGAKGKLFGVEWQVIGWLERRCRVEGEDYYWEEYLLYDPRTAGQRYLVESDGHWSFAAAVPAGEITEGLRGPVYQGKLYRPFAKVMADVTGVLGEFSWEVRLGEQAQANDYLAVPESLSEELSDGEVNWSHAVYLEAEQVEKAFGARLRTPGTVGMMQPNPWRPRVQATLPWLGIGLAAALALFVAFAVRSSPVVYDQTFAPIVGKYLPGGGGAVPARLGGELEPDQDVPADPQRPEAGTVRVSAPFRIEQGHRNLQVQLSTTVDNTWAAVAGALVNQATSEVSEFALEAAYYHGYEGGESWSEGSHAATTYLSAVEPGEYVLRLETLWEPGKRPPTFHLKLTSGVARPLHLALVLALLALVPLFAVWRLAAFEKARWGESNLVGSED